MLQPTENSVRYAPFRVDANRLAKGLSSRHLLLVKWLIGSIARNGRITHPWRVVWPRQRLMRMGQSVLQSRPVGDFRWQRIPMWYRSQMPPQTSARERHKPWILQTNAG